MVAGRGSNELAFVGDAGFLSFVAKLYADVLLLVRSLYVGDGLSPDSRLVFELNFAEGSEYLTE